MVVFEQSPLPYGKIMDGLPRWHAALRRKEYETVSEKLSRPGVRFVVLTRVLECLNRGDEAGLTLTTEERRVAGERAVIQR